MREIPVTEAKSRLLQFLDEVESGASFRLTRHGRAIARILPESQARNEEALAAAAAIRTLGSRQRGMSTDEILSARDEGRRS